MSKDAAQDPGTNIVKYGSWTPEQAEKESKDLSNTKDFWKASVGRNVVRFLPPKVDWPSPFVVRYQHFVVVPGLANKVIYSCPREHKAGWPCVTCDKADKLERSGSRRDTDTAKKLRPQKSVLANIIADPGNKDAAPLVFSFGKKIHEALKQIRSDTENGGDFMHPDKGFCIVINRKGTGKDDTEYTVAASRNTNKLANMAWIEEQVDCRRLIRIPTVDQQNRLLAGEDPRDVWSDDGDGAPRRRRGGEDDGLGGKSRDDIEDAELVDDGPNVADDLDGDDDIHVDLD